MTFTQNDHDYIRKYYCEIYYFASNLNTSSKMY